MHRPSHARRRGGGGRWTAPRGAVEGDGDPGATLAGGRLSGRAGYGAVECARGRLYHVAALDADGRIGAYAVLAPTEWNFYAHGPYVAALKGQRIGEGEEGLLAAARLAALVDPCVAFRVAPCSYPKASPAAPSPPEPPPRPATSRTAERGDALVPLASALGRHERSSAQLSFAPDRQWIACETGASIS